MGVLATLDNSDHKSLCPQISSSLEEVSFAFLKVLGIFFQNIYHWCDFIFTCILLSDVCLSYYTHSTMKAKTAIVLLF